jgi:hypothetical protein
VGRIPLYSYRVSCRISKKAGQVLETLLERIAYRRGKKPTGKILSRLILLTTAEQWEAVLNPLPKQHWRDLTSKEQKRILAEQALLSDKEKVRRWAEE